MTVSSSTSVERTRGDESPRTPERTRASTAPSPSQTGETSLPSSLLSPLTEFLDEQILRVNAVFSSLHPEPSNHVTELVPEYPENSVSGARNLLGEFDAAAREENLKKIHERTGYDCRPPKKWKRNDQDPPPNGSAPLIPV